VTDAAAQAGAPPASSAASASPWLIAILVALAAFMEVLDTTIANVVLPYIAGGMGVSDDEASWVVTTYLVANAVSLTASPFLAKWLGRKTFFLICLGLFSVSSILCAQAWNLDSLLLFRLLQGLRCFRSRRRRSRGVCARSGSGGRRQRRIERGSGRRNNFKAGRNNSKTRRNSFKAKNNDIKIHRNKIKMHSRNKINGLNSKSAKVHLCPLTSP
jgi:Major Facilitator Superfamily